VLHQDRSAADRKGRTGDLLDLELIEQDTDARDVENGVDLADLVKMNLGERDSVHARLRFTQARVDRRGSRLLLLCEAAALDRLEHVGEFTLRARLVRVRAIVSVVVVVFARDLEIEERRRDTTLVDATLLDAPALHGDRAQRALECGALAARVQQRADQHVSAGATDHFDVRDVHGAGAGRSHASW
jgi:hypothetical protein